MKQDEQQLSFERSVDKMRNIMLKKGNDYAGDTDRLSNFKTAGAICKMTAQQHCLALIATKVARLATLFQSGKSPDNESIDDSCIDLCNYALLLGMIEQESREQAKQQSAKQSQPC